VKALTSVTKENGVEGFGGIDAAGWTEKGVEEDYREAQNMTMIKYCNLSNI